jgi:hypothetical protein
MTTGAARQVIQSGQVTPIVDRTFSLVELRGGI